MDAANFAGTWLERYAFQLDMCRKRMGLSIRGYASLEGLCCADGIGLACAVGAVGVGGGFPYELHGCRAVVVVVGDDIVAKAGGHIAVGVIGESLALDHGGGCGA